MPEVNPSESKKSYLKRCIPYLIKEGKKSDQAYAICNSMYEQSKKKKQAKGDTSEPNFDDEQFIIDYPS